MIAESDKTSGMKPRIIRPKGRTLGKNLGLGGGLDGEFEFRLRASRTDGKPNSCWFYGQARVERGRTATGQTRSNLLYFMLPGAERGGTKQNTARQLPCRFAATNCPGFLLCDLLTIPDMADKPVAKQADSADRFRRGRRVGYKVDKAFRRRLLNLQDFQIVLRR